MNIGIIGSGVIGATMARFFSEASRRAPRATWAAMRGTMPAEYVDAFFDFFANGTYDDSRVYPTVQELTGRKPRTFEQWSMAHADAFGRP